MNVAGRFAGSTDTPLTQRGRKQAIKAGKKAKNLEINLIISSPLSRAHETAKIIAKEINYPEAKIQLNPMLAERSYGAMEGQLYSPDMNLDGVSDAETTKKLLLRAKEFVDSLKHLESNNVLIVSHGSIGRAIRHHILEDFPFHKYIRLENADLVQWL